MSLIDKLDLTRFTRSSKTCSTTVWVGDTFKNSRLWIECGEIELAPRNLGIWSFGARLGRAASDVEHDSSWAFRFDVIGVEMELVSYGQTHIRAFVGSGSDFRILRPGQNPFLGAGRCDICDKKHPITKYLPDHDPDLMAKLVGQPLSIRTGVRFKESK